MGSACRWQKARTHDCMARDGRRHRSKQPPDVLDSIIVRPNLQAHGHWNSRHAHLGSTPSRLCNSPSRWNSLSALGSLSLIIEVGSARSGRLLVRSPYSDKWSFRSARDHLHTVTVVWSRRRWLILKACQCRMYTRRYSVHRRRML